VTPGGNDPKAWLPAGLTLAFVGAAVPAYLADSWTPYWRIQITVVLTLATLHLLRRWLP